MALLKCSRCGKVMTYEPAAMAGRVKCAGCGTWLRVPTSTPVPAPKPAPSIPPTAASRPRPSSRPSEPSQPWKWIAVGALCATAALLVALMAMIVSLGSNRSDQRYLDGHRDQFLALKADAERLTLAGQLVEAHAKYRELEQLVGGRTAKDPALWDLLERAKQDQDRVYGVMLEQMKALASASASPEPSRTQVASQANALRKADYRGFQDDKPTTAPATRPAPSPSSRSTLAMAAARPAQPTTVPATQPAPKVPQAVATNDLPKPTTRPAQVLADAPVTGA
ncbi:MAG TPA: hypothetical protein VHP11_14775, partial [Tepidisphaeraceae bacterium]|nr:hypothetical protein [Tepidisphaeraceae bacterium]